MPRVLTAAHSAINWDDPLSKGLLAFVTYPSGGRPVDLVGIGQVKYTGSLASVGGLSPYGTAGDHPQTTTGQGWSISNICNRPATAAAGSVLYIRRRYGALADSGFGCTSASTTSFGGHLVWNDGNLYWDFGGNAGSNRLSATSPDLTVDSVLIMTAGPSGSYIYQNGKLLASSATAITRSLSTSDFGLTYGNSITNTSSRVDTLTIVAERQWTPQEVRLLTLDPFCLVEPTRGRRTVILLNSGVSSGASGTISNTLADVTSSISGTVTPPAVTGSIANTLANVTSSVSGTVTAPGVTGTISVTLADVTSSIAGVIAPAGTIAAILDNVQPAISGSVANPPTESQLVLRSTLPVITSEAQLIVPAHQYAYARVTNKTGVTIYVGGADVTTANGYPIANNGSEQFELRMTDALYAVAASGSNNLNVLVQIH